MELAGQEQNYKKLLEVIRPYGSAAIAFSGGTDSSLLAFAAAEALGAGNVICITARARSFPEREHAEAVKLCKAMGIRHLVFDFNELGVEGFSSNPENRCYLCKRDLLSKIISMAGEAGISTVFEGSNLDDEGDFRPGMQAVSELGVKSPLREAGLRKEEIRALSKACGLASWDRPSFACLASRFAYGEEITPEKLDMVDKAEQFLIDRGFTTVRVRILGTECFTARIEVLPDDIPRLAGSQDREGTEIFLKSIGFTYVTLDLSGYRTGSMNEGIKTKA